MVPVEVTAMLQESLSDVMTVAALSVVVVIAIAAFKFMQKAVGGSDPWAGYTMADDIHDRALSRNAERPFQEVGNGVHWKSDRAAAARDVTRNQKWY